MNLWRNAITGKAIVILLAIILVSAGFYFIFFYIPPPTTVARTYTCLGGGSTASNSSAGCAFTIIGTNLSIAVKPSDSNLAVNKCVYSTTNVTMPVRCGPLCGGPWGLGNAYRYSRQLELNFSFVPNSASSDYSATLSTVGTRLSGFFLPTLQIFVNSRNVTWSTVPPSFDFPCTRNIPYYTLCSISQNATSIVFEFPSNYGNSYQLLINSTEMLVP